MARILREGKRAAMERCQFCAKLSAQKDFVTSAMTVETMAARNDVKL